MDLKPMQPHKPARTPIGIEGPEDVPRGCKAKVYFDDGTTAMIYALSRENLDKSLEALGCALPLQKLQD